MASGDDLYDFSDFDGSVHYVEHRKLAFILAGSPLERFIRNPANAALFTPAPAVYMGKERAMWTRQGTVWLVPLGWIESMRGAFNQRQST